jgi:hypothetical protein
MSLAKISQCIVLVVSLIFILLDAVHAQDKQPKYFDARLSIDKRVDGLVNRMTSEEKSHS